MLGPISIDPDGFLTTLRRLAAERNGVPSVAETRRTEGTSAGVTKDFHAEVTLAANKLSEVISVVLKELDATHEAIRKTAEDMVAQDASLADEAETILAVLDSTRASAPTTPSAPAVAPRAF